VDPNGDGGRELTQTGLVCGSCGAQSSPAAKFCSECGTRLTQATRSAEYKQVTVLFADVVHSMDIAAAVDAERLREIMTELVTRASAVVQRYGGTVDKFTGDGIMAVFGAPTALEDHAVRACLAALGVQQEVKRLAADVQDRDGVDLRLRVGLNSGQVIAGEIGSDALGYTAVGQQVGMAQRMESAAPPGGVMLSVSTARLVEGTSTLGEVELVQIKGADAPVPARRLLGMCESHRTGGRTESNLVGRRWEMSAVEGLLDRATDGHGAVIGVVGSPGIGKSRLVREVTVMAEARGMDVFTAYCESHTNDVPFYVVARLLRAAIGVGDLDGGDARAQVRARVPDGVGEDLVLFDDLLGIADPVVALPRIDPDARRRRLTALINAASLARDSPAVYVIEDAHWIDEVSESMLADLLTVIPQTPSLVLITYRPEYRGALSRVPGAQSIALAPLSDPETAVLVIEQLGPDSSVGGLATMIVERAAGNPFFVEEMVRELAERDVLRGNRSAYVSTAGAAEVSVPATVQATIAARIDRLDPAAKRTLSAAAVIGSRFDPRLLETLGIEPVLTDLVGGELIDQITFTGQPEYVFHHPLIRMVAYESQLKSDLAQLHRRLAAAIEQRDPGSADENAALIAEHLEAAGDLHLAYAWHMRAATWATNRDMIAAQTSWRRAREVADRLPVNDPDRASMRIAPRTLLSGHAFRFGGGGADTGFEELRELCTAAGDQVSLAVGMTGLVMTQWASADRRASSRLASEHTALLESIGDPTLTVALTFPAMVVREEAGDMAEMLRLAQRVVDLADGHPTVGNLVLGSPLACALAFRGEARWCLGSPGWRDDFAQAAAMARAADPISLALVNLYTYALAVPNGVLLCDTTALAETANALAIAERSADEISLYTSRFARGITLAHHEGSKRDAGLTLLAEVREAAVQQRFTLQIVPIVDIHLAQQEASSGNLDAAIERARVVLDDLFDSGGSIWSVLAATVLVEALLRRGTAEDIQAANSTVERLAAVPTDPGFVLHEIWLLRLRALLGRAHGDAAAYAHFRDRYRDVARTLGFEGHIAWADAMA
jgi:adenylate cyclase